ncbi:MAG TPA: hypothetical protein VGD92_02215, partial [Sphingobacteriaceae bacterium]
MVISTPRQYRRQKFIALALAFGLSSGVASAQAPDTTKKDSTKAKKAVKDLPLEPGRKIRIHTNEGSWMSLDVSPDGKSVIFAALGDLYMIPITGGKAEPVTTGMAYDSQPRFSPDGKTIVFISDRDGNDNIWTMNLATKKTRQVSKGKVDYIEAAEWTPDGEYLIAAKGRRNLKLFMYHKDGGTGVQLIKTPDNMKTIEPAFGKDSRYIWFSRRNGAWNYNAQLPQYQLATFDRETGEVEG